MVRRMENVCRKGIFRTPGYLSLHLLPDAERVGREERMNSRSNAEGRRWKRSWCSEEEGHPPHRERPALSLFTTHTHTVSHEDIYECTQMGCKRKTYFAHSLSSKSRCATAQANLD